MTAVDYPACLRDLIESEIFGEAVSRAIWEVARNDRERYHFATLMQLETETKARLRPLLARFAPGTLQLEAGVQTFDPAVAERIGRGGS